MASREPRSIARRSTLAPSALVLLGGMLLAADANASGVIHVEITMLGPDAVRVRLAEGKVFPCDSSDNRMLVQGRFSAGEVIRADATRDCVCVQQTFASFPDVDWSAPQLACRPLNCAGIPRGRRCPPAPDVTIRIQIASRP
jgi:hypothetical protein